MGVSKNSGTQNGWFILEHSLKMDDLGVPLFSETAIYIYTNKNAYGYMYPGWCQPSVLNHRWMWEWYFYVK